LTVLACYLFLSADNEPVITTAIHAVFAYSLVCAFILKSLVPGWKLFEVLTVPSTKILYSTKIMYSIEY